MPYKDPEKRREYHRKYLNRWVERNREYVRNQARRRYWANPEKARAKTNTNRRRAEQSYETRARRYHRQKIAVLKRYSGAQPHCACCGESKYEFLTIDHIIPIKRKRAGSHGGEHLFSYLYKRPAQLDVYQVLCFNCNCAKSAGTCCPHVKSKFDTLREWEEWANLKRSPNVRSLEELPCLNPC